MDMNNPDFDFETDSLTVAHVLKVLVLFSGGIFTSSVGVGGGAFYTIAAILLFGLVYEAIPLSKVSSLATALSYFVQNVLLPVPKVSNHKFRFAYDVMMVMEPSTLFGTIFGIIASRMVPFWLISLMAVVVLSISARITFRKGATLRAEELSSKAHEKTKIVSDRSKISYGTLTSSSKEYEETSTEEFYLIGRSIFTIIVCFCLVATNSFVLDGRGGFTVECGGILYFFSLAIHSALILLLVNSNIQYLLSYRKHTENLGKNSNLTLNWTRQQGWFTAAVCFAAGFVSSFCGVGGSTIKNPILLYLNINPTLAKATSQVMLLTTVGASVLQFYVQGSIPANFAILFFSSSISSAVLGKTLIDGYVRKNHSQSTIVYLLAVYVSLSVVALGSIGLVIVIGQFSDTSSIDWKQLWFRSPCSSTPLDMGALRLFSGGL